MALPRAAPTHPLTAKTSPLQQKGAGVGWVDGIAALLGGRATVSDLSSNLEKVEDSSNSVYKAISQR